MTFETWLGTIEVEPHVNVYANVTVSKGDDTKMMYVKPHIRYINIPDFNIKWNGEEIPYIPSLVQVAIFLMQK